MIYIIINWLQSGSIAFDLVLIFAFSIIFGSCLTYSGKDDTPFKDKSTSQKIWTIISNIVFILEITLLLITLY